MSTWEVDSSVYTIVEEDSGITIFFEPKELTAL